MENISGRVFLHPALFLKRIYQNQGQRSISLDRQKKRIKFQMGVSDGVLRTTCGIKLRKIASFYN